MEKMCFGAGKNRLESDCLLPPISYCSAERGFFLCLQVHVDVLMLFIVIPRSIPTQATHCNVFSCPTHIFKVQSNLRLCFGEK